MDVKHEVSAPNHKHTNNNATSPNIPHTIHDKTLFIHVHRQVSRKKSLSAPPIDERNSVILSHTSISISPPYRCRSSRLEDVITPKVIHDMYYRGSLDNR